MAVTTPFVQMAASPTDVQNVSLIKLVAWLRDFATGGISGNDGTINVLSAAASSTHQIIKASAGKLYSVSAFNTTGATVYLHVFDATDLPANGTIPTLAPLPIATVSIGSIDFTTWGRPFTNGIVAAFSSTAATLTSASGGIFDATYR